MIVNKVAKALHFQPPGYTSMMDAKYDNQEVTGDSNSCMEHEEDLCLLQYQGILNWSFSQEELLARWNSTQKRKENPELSIPSSICFSVFPCFL